MIRIIQEFFKERDEVVRRVCAGDRVQVVTDKYKISSDQDHLEMGWRNWLIAWLRGYGGKYRVLPDHEKTYVQGVDYYSYGGMWGEPPWTALPSYRRSYQRWEKIARVKEI